MQQQLLTAAKRSCILRIHITMVDDVRFKGSLPCKSSLWIGIARPFGTLVIATKSSISRLVIGYHWWYLRFWVTRSVTVHAKEIGTSRFIYAKKSLNSSTSIKLKNDLVSWIFITITFGGKQTRVFVDLAMVRVFFFLTYFVHGCRCCSFTCKPSCSNNNLWLPMYHCFGPFTFFSSL